MIKRSRDKGIEKDYDIATTTWNPQRYVKGGEDDITAMHAFIFRALEPCARASVRYSSQRTTRADVPYI